MPVPTRAIDRLRKAANLEPSKREVELSDGSVFEMYVSPLTMAERERAQKQAKSDDASAFALQLKAAKSCFLLARLMCLRTRSRTKTCSL
jgi:hypothetical protein